MDGEKMKTIVVHDKRGKIIAFAIPVAEFADEIGVAPGPGQTVLHVDSAEFGIPAEAFGRKPGAKPVATFPDIIKDFHIKSGRVEKRPQRRKR
jgi:hypothetical protein